MELIKSVFEMVSNAGSYEKSKNYYFERHQCPNTRQEEKIQLDYHIYKDNPNTGSVDIVHFGFCPKCSKLYYNTDIVNNVTIK